jgi:hypothetical protein
MLQSLLIFGQASVASQRVDAGNMQHAKCLLCTGLHLHGTLLAQGTNKHTRMTGAIRFLP